VSEARLELRQHQTQFLGALAALSADYLEAGNITEVEHQARLQAYLTAQNELGLARSEALGAKSELGQLLGTPYAVFSNLSVPIWSTADHTPVQHTAELESALAANKHLRSVATQIPIADNLRDRLRWARWLPGLGMTIEVEKEDGTQKGPKIEVDLPTFDTQSDALLSLSKRAQRARQQVALLERDIEFEIGRLADQLDAEAAVLRRLEHQILPLQRKRLALRQREESYMLIDVFELAEVKLTLLEQLHELLDATERYWLDQASLSHQRGLLLREADALVWQQFLPGSPTGSQTKEEGHDHHGAHRMDHSGHDMSGSGHQMGHDGHSMDHSDHGVSPDTHEMDYSGHDMSGSGHQMGHDGHGMDHSDHEMRHGTHEMGHSGRDMSEGSHEMGHDQYDADHSGHGMSGSSHQIEHEAHGKDHSGHSMPQGMDPLGGKVGGIGTDHTPAASGVQKEHSSHQHRDSHERAPKQNQVKRKASTVDGAASGH
ncbi:MAG: TolC family protein, partial [Gammaproteobacteria bacterium]